MPLSFASRLVEVMRIRGITCHSLSTESGYSEKYISELRVGVKSNPSIECVKCLATVLDVSPSYLAGWSVYIYD